jgi:hypothetical protein
MTHTASLFLIFGVRYAWESYVVMVLYGLTGTRHCLWTFAISAAAFAINHKIIIRQHQMGCKQREFVEKISAAGFFLKSTIRVRLFIEKYKW